jgi:hypothetical protein
MDFEPLRDPLYEVRFFSLHRQILRFAECLEVIYSQLSLNGERASQSFTTNVPWQDLLPRTAPERFVHQSTSSISHDLSGPYR